MKGRECEGIPTPDGGTETLCLRNPPDGNRNGSGVTPDGTVVAIPREAWNHAIDGRTDCIRFENRQREDGTAYLWLAPHRGREGRENRRRDVPASSPSSEGVSPPAPRTERFPFSAAMLGNYARVQSDGHMAIFRHRQRDTVLQLTPETAADFEAGRGKCSVEREPGDTVWREVAEAVSC